MRKETEITRLQGTKTVAFAPQYSAPDAARGKTTLICPARPSFGNRAGQTEALLPRTTEKTEPSFDI